MDGRGVDRGGLPVHGIHVFCQSCDHHRALPVRTPAGIRPQDAPGFMVAQFGSAVGALLFRQRIHI